LAASHIHGAAEVSRKWASSSCQLTDIIGMLLEAN
jgi:hypothetical protein